jgi:hypothetical protein
MATGLPFADAASPCMMECLRNTQGINPKNGENLALFSVFGKLSELLRRKFASFAWRKTGVFGTLSVMDMEQNVAACYVAIFSAVVRRRADFLPRSRVYGSAPLGTEIHQAMFQPQKPTTHSHEM